MIRICEALAHVRLDHIERIDDLAFTYTGAAFAVQI